MQSISFQFHKWWISGKIWINFRFFPIYLHFVISPQIHSILNKFVNISTFSYSVTWKLTKNLFNIFLGDIPYFIFWYTRDCFIYSFSFIFYVKWSILAWNLITPQIWIIFFRKENSNNLDSTDELTKKKTQITSNPFIRFLTLPIHIFQI